MAIDLFLGYESRKHGDIDINAYWKDRNSIILYMQSQGYSVYEMLGGGLAHHIWLQNYYYYANLLIQSEKGISKIMN